MGPAWSRPWCPDADPFTDAGDVGAARMPEHRWTPRDEFARAAMISAGPSLADRPAALMDHAWLARECYAIADAFLAERDRRPV